MNNEQNVTRFVDCFDAVYDKNSEILVLGSNPPPDSREAGFYYSGSRNNFWKVLPKVLNESAPETTEQKIAMCLKHKIALWDVLKCCTRIGAADNTIADAVPNDIKSLVKKTKIKRIYCLGRTALEKYEEFCEKDVGIKAEYLPSSSMANNAQKDKLEEAYKVLAK